MSAEILQKIADEVAGCTKCPLAKGRCKAVPGEGSPEAKVMFIGEGPGYHEDQQGRPFVGPSGELLGHLLNKVKLQREDVFITNVVKCRPPNNRDPEIAELEACKNYLDRQIAAINPHLIITLGRFSMARYWPGKRISEVHGQPKVEGGRMFMAMFHPAAALRDRYGPLMQKFKEDGLRIPGLLEQAEELARAQLWGLPLPNLEPQNTTPPVVAVAEPEVIETAPVSEAAAPLVIAEKKNGYRAKLPKVEKIGPEVLAEVPPLEVMAEATELIPAPALAEVTAPKRARKPKQTEPVIETVFGEAVPPLMETSGTSSEISKEKEKPSVVKRKKKESDSAAEQLSMF